MLGLNKKNSRVFFCCQDSFVYIFKNFLTQHTSFDALELQTDEVMP